MAKFPKIPKLEKKVRENLLLAFCDALTSITNKGEAAQFLTDLLSPQEFEMLSKRLEIAKLLIDNYTCEEIRKMIKVSYNTIARVNSWLTLSGTGFRLVIERQKKKEKSKDQDYLDDRFNPYSWNNIKKRYSMYFLPELIIDEIIKQSNIKEQKKIHAILSSIESKPDVFREIDKRYRQQFSWIKKRLK